MSLLDRFEDEVRRDLRVFGGGADLTDLLVKRRYRTLISLILSMPSNCHYRVAIANDPDEVSKMVYTAEDDKRFREAKDGMISPIGWDLTHDLLTTLIEVVVKLGAGKNAKNYKMPRPSTLSERYQVELRNKFVRDNSRKYLNHFNGL